MPVLGETTTRARGATGFTEVEAARRGETAP
jgi:hypothetical protein